MTGTLGVACRLLCLALGLASVLDCSIDVEYLRSGGGNPGGGAGMAGGERGGAAGSGGWTDTGIGGAGGPDGSGMMGGRGGSEMDASLDGTMSDGEAGDASDAIESSIEFDASVCAPGACKRVFVSDKPPA